jgi:tRNA A-37 threonylcarbamoyl transferase component Bud32/tetratricopeptide (TPR) repeat protein
MKEVSPAFTARSALVVFRPWRKLVIRHLPGVPVPTSLFDVLQAALSSSYALERELPGGGMSRVFLATETALGRHVVVKVIAPELSQSLSAERFRREIQVAAQLQHPHIVPLLAAGQTAGLLYYTMPFVEGESLRERLDRDGELPVQDTVRLLGEIARALSYAHRQGIVHRDIKPANILLAEGQVQVTDFGLARALSGSVETRALSEGGIALGTPLYMAPEQAAGEPAVDHRADLYALGLVAYEMLTGAPPFTGRSRQALLAAHAMETPVAVRTHRPSVPPGLQALVMRLLEKRPADRAQTADEVLLALGTSLVPAGDTTDRGVARPLRTPGRRLRWLSHGTVLVVALVAGILTWRVRQHGAATATVNEQVVAVVPFRVTGTDTSLRYLREGMLDLLSTSLSGTVDLRTVDPRTLLSAWHRAGGAMDKDLDRTRDLALARELGAGRVLEGEVTGTANRIVLSAVLSPAIGGKEIASSVEGPPDSLTWLVDELTAQLLSLGAGEPKARLSALTSTSLPALRAYLDGRSALRHGAYPEAVHRFDEAMELDTTFALAGLGRTQGAIWLGEGYDGLGSKLAWRHRDRLASRDRALLAFFLSPDWPNLISTKGALEQAEAMVAASPDNIEALVAYADYMYHYGNLVGIPDAVPRSLRVYRRALALDSSYALSWEHLGEIYFRIGDTTGASQAIHVRLGQDSVSHTAARDRWFARRVLGDSSIAPQPLTDPRLVDRPGEVLRLTIAFGGPFSDADSLLGFALASAQGEQDRARHQRWARWYYLSRGWPNRALQVTTADGTWDVIAELIRDAIICDGDSALAARLAREAARNFRPPAPHENWSRIVAQYVAAQFQLINGDPRPAREAVRSWLTTPFRTDSVYAVLIAQLAARLLDAQLAARDRRPDARATLEQLDSLIQTGVTPDLFLELVGNIEVARLWYAQGDPARALRSVRRRSEGYEASTLPRYLRDEGRYAALTADRPGAMKAYRHYLLLRSDAEPSLQPEVAAVRAELETLEKTYP